MHVLHGTIVLSLIAPGIVASGLWGVITTLTTAICAFKTKNMFSSMMAGMIIIIIQRSVF
jgi:uncharacterized membrane protein